MKRSKLVVVLLVAAALGIGMLFGTALADRSATAPPIVYSGQAIDGSGAPIPDSAANTVSLSLYDGPDAGTDTRLCPVVTSTTVASRAGHFSLALSAACADVFSSAEEVWVHLTVNGTTISATRAGAVPYAVTSERVLLHGATADVTSTGLFCGYSPSPTTGAISTTVGGLPVAGYAAARALCATAPGCGRTAHMCTSTELVRTAELGGVPGPPSGSDGWYASGVRSLFGGVRLSDCLGYTAVGTESGSIWDSAIEAPNVNACTVAYHIICCD